jgi:hypothetical protein
MRHYLQDKYLMGNIEDASHEAIFVAANIKNAAITDAVSGRIVTSYVGPILPVTAKNMSMPR